jgi:hypothetical protein
LCAAATNIISADNTTLFFKGGVITLEQPEVKINKIYGIKLTKSASPIKSIDSVIYINHVIENLGNTSSKIRLQLVPNDLPDGWRCELIKDENRNGLREDSESQNVPQMLDLAEGSTYSFFVKFTRSSEAKRGDIGSVLIRVSCLAKDGNAYTGYNGTTYGGEDEESCIDKVIME